MASASFDAQHGAANTHKTSVQSVTALKRWSILNKQPPAVADIKALHVYDFDNTLFKTPLPNPKLWNGSTISLLSGQDTLVNGGWWHDSGILSATGEGLDKEQARAWQGWWNENVVELVRLSTEQKDALCVLLTGRSEVGFSGILKTMITSKGLEFDLVSLKPTIGPDNQRISSTMQFKQTFLACLMETYVHADEIRVYEDRPKHVKAFRDFFEEYNRKQSIVGTTLTRGPITAEVVHVADCAVNLAPEVEIGEVQRCITQHNALIPHKGRKGLRNHRLCIKKTVFYTGYQIERADTERLLTLAQMPPNVAASEVKLHANTIMIWPRACPPYIVDKIGSLGSKMKWKVTGTACLDSSVWAARLEPVPSTAKFHTSNPCPLVVLALRKGFRPGDAGKIQNWQPVPEDKAFVFETTLGEKMILRIDAEEGSEKESESSLPSKSFNKRHVLDAPRGPSGHNHASGSRYDHKQSHQGGRGGPGFGRGRGGAASRGFRNGSRGAVHKAGRYGRGGGSHHYKSLDDVGTRDQQGVHGQVSYEDSPLYGQQPLPSLPHHQQPQDLQSSWAGQQQHQQQLSHQPCMPRQPQDQRQLFASWSQASSGPAFSALANRPPTGPSSGAGGGAGGLDVGNFY